MRGLTIHSANESSSEDGIRLLFSNPNIEIMVQKLKKGAFVCLTPSSDLNATEFFYLLSGKLRIVLPAETVHLEAGSSFYANNLEQDVSLESEEDGELLYVANKPVYDDLLDYRNNLNDLINQVDEKDHYTLRHSHNVMEISIQIAQYMAREQQEIYNLANGSLFHDVGKCFVPDEILKKPSKLTEEEYAIIKKHPLDSARLLESRFGEHVAEIARNHHERLNGSGYPLGLTKDQVSLESRIVAVADSFDTMTARRVYTIQPKTYLQAAEELCSLPHLYDEDVCKALLELVKSGKIAPKEE